MNSEINIDQIIELTTTYGLKILAAIAIFLIGKWVARRLSSLVSKLLDKQKVDPTISSFAGNLSYAMLFTFVIIAALGQVGVQTASFVAIIGAAGLAVGLALQGSLSNFASGVLILLFRPFKNGDFVEAAGTSGIIEEIHIFHTQMRSGDNKTIIIPNSNITGGNIVNYSTKPTRRVDMVFGIGYDADIKAAKDILEKLVKEDERVLADPAPVIAVSELADSSVNFVCRPFVNSADYWAVYFDMHEKVKTSFDAAGISIPFPQMDVHLTKDA